MEIKEKCKLPDGIVIMPDGEHELDPCEYDVVEVHRNVTVEVLRCRKCGNEEISWIRQEDTVDEYIDPDMADI